MSCDCVKREDVDLMEIISLAPNIYMFDIEPSGAWRIRYFGSTLRNVLGRDDTGKDLRKAMSGPHKDKVVDCLNQMIDTHRPVWSKCLIRTGQVHSVIDRIDISYERLAYPLLNTRGDVGHAVGMIVAHPSEPHQTEFQSRLLD